MSKQGHILIVDDMKIWREELVETLQHGGFYATSASTASEALKMLNENLYHMLVLDLRMNENDQGNIDGIELLHELERRGLSEATKVIMLSAHGTPEHMRTSFSKYSVVDFLSKDDFDNKVFLENVQQVFSRKVNTNLALTIHWQQGSGPEQVVLNMDIDGTPASQGTPLHSQIAVELEDLLRRLFYQAESVLVRPLAAGQSGTRVLRVQPFYATRGGGHEVVVKFGAFRKIEEEHGNFKEYVQPFLGGGRNTSVFDLRRTPHLGGIIYSLLGTTNERLEDFGEFYQHADVSQIDDTLDRLFLDTCGAWYANHGQLQPLDLAKDYQNLLEYTPGRLENVVVEHLKSVQGQERLTFNHLKGKRTFTNPWLAAKGVSLVVPTYICITHGDFNHHNLLVDGKGNMWMIDFQGTGQSHILRDIAILDSAIRFQLLPPEEATLRERLHMEEDLCSIERFSQVKQLAAKSPKENQTLAKAYATALHLRTLAGELVERNPNADLSEYHIALFYTALNTLRFSSLAEVQREHALLSASLLADRLGLGQNLTRVE